MLLCHGGRARGYCLSFGGDEFVVIAPGLTSEAARDKAKELRELAQQTGREVCRENIISLSVGRAVYPDDGADAEGLLATADRRMYIEKRSQSTRRNRRQHPRLRTRLTIELEPQGSEIPIAVTLVNISLGGCYLETAVILPKDSGVKLAFAHADISLYAEGTAVRIDPGAGVAIQFREPSHEGRNQLLSILQLVENITVHSERSVGSGVLAHDSASSE